jgi:hypothetical protein
MAVTETTTTRLRLAPTDTVDPDATAKHVDQLHADTLQTIARAANGHAHQLDPTDTRLSPGDVVVYTTYLRVERA